MGIITPGALGKSPLDKKPKAYKGLLQSVVLDKFGQQKFPTMGGGGAGSVRSFGSHGTARSIGRDAETTTAPGRGSVRVQELPEAKGWTPTFRNRSTSTDYGTGRVRRSEGGRPMEQVITVDTPSGQRVTFDQYQGKASMDFFPTTGGGVTRPSIGQGDLQHTANTFGHVMTAMKHYVQTFKPKSLKYYGADNNLQRLYDRASPQLAKGLGAVHTRDGRYHILNFGDD